MTRGLDNEITKPHGILGGGMGPLRQRGRAAPRQQLQATDRCLAPSRGITRRRFAGDDDVERLDGAEDSGPGLPETAFSSVGRHLRPPGIIVTSACRAVHRVRPHWANSYF